MDHQELVELIGNPPAWMRATVDAAPRFTPAQVDVLRSAFTGCARDLHPVDVRQPRGQQEAA